MTLFKALPVVGIAIVGVSVAGVGSILPATLPPLTEIEATALLVLYAFVGFENCVVPAGETKSPQTTIPRALIITVMATVLLYFFVQVAYVSVMPIGPAPTNALATLADTLLGPAGFLILSLTAMISIAGNLMSSVTSTPRVAFALSEAKSLPRWFGHVSPRWQTPVNSILFMGGLGAILALTGDFLGLAIVSSLARLFVYGLSIAALPFARSRAGLKTGIPLLALVLGGLAFCIWAAWQSPGAAWALLGVLVVVGLLLYAITRYQAKASSAARVSSIQPPPSTRSPE